MDDGDRSSIEIKQLLLKLSPKLQHKDRVRSLQRFRNYVAGESSQKNTTPPFYDDDVPLLFLGSALSNTTYVDDDVHGEFLQSYVGLFQACATPSKEHAGGLKRSTRNAMSLLKYLVIDFVEMKDGEPQSDGVDPNTGLPELNVFAYAFCSLSIPELRICNLEAHLGDLNRGGAKDDACAVISLLLTRHFDAISDNATVMSNAKETSVPNISIEELLPSMKTRQVFENWMVQNLPRDVQNVIRSNSLAAKSSANQATGGGGSLATKGDGRPMTASSGIMPPVNAQSDENGVELEINLLDAFKKKNKKPGIDEEPTEEQKAIAEAELHSSQQLENLGLKLINKQFIGEQQAEPGQNLDGSNHLPTCWRDSQLAKIPHHQETSQIQEMERKREKDVEQEQKIQKEHAERQKLIGRDPLGIRPDHFDLKAIKNQTLELLNQAIKDLEEEMAESGMILGDANNEGGGGADDTLGTISTKRKKDKKAAIHGYAVDQLVSLEAQRDALVAILEGRQRGITTEDFQKDDEKQEGNAETKDKDEDEDEEDVDEKVVPITELSILPTDENFNPLLFLTLVHRNASFEQFMEGIERLNGHTDNQTQRIQDLVLNNFRLFIRCADGVDLFSEKGRSKGDGEDIGGGGVNSRLDSLDELAQSCSDQAKKSFKPLLDNTDEVRKVQSAIAVLNRVGPLLQIPSLMRQHIENGRFSAAVKAYRRVLVIEDDNKIELLKHVKVKATEAARHARCDLELRLANPTIPVQSILDSLRDLEELIELDIPTDPEDDEKFTDQQESEVAAFVGVSSPSVGKFEVGDSIVDVREHPPCLACLLLQAAHFSLLVKDTVSGVESSCNDIYGKHTLPAVEEGQQAVQDVYGHVDDKTAATSQNTTLDSKATTDKRERNRWKYEVLEERVDVTIRAVSIARTWLPRLLRIGEAARQADKRRAARAGRKRAPYDDYQDGAPVMTAFDVFITNIGPSVRLLVEHCSFTSLGCYNEEESKELKMTFGFDSELRLQNLLRSPLPAVQTTKCASELAELADVVQTVNAAAIELRPNENDIDGGMSPGGKSSSHYQRVAMESALEEISGLIEEAVVTVERRKCIYAFDQCGRTCMMRASGGGVFDGNAILACVQTLAEELTRPEQCGDEIENGCGLVVTKCCEGLDSYVQDRGDSARLRAVAECASALVDSIGNICKEAVYLTNGQCEFLEESLLKKVTDLETTMFDEFLESIRRNISTYTRLGPMGITEQEEDEYLEAKKKPETKFPAYLSASLLAIVRCRAQVERTLGEKTLRKSQNVPYQFLAMSTAADSVVDGICYEMDQRIPQMRGSHADAYLNELQFLINTLRKYLSDDLMNVAEHCRSKLLSRAGGGFEGGVQDLCVIEELERLGRVYVLCLGD